uniref:Chitobiosyldiphosphodolichol beta-mannosyltransferase n=3 Tax=Parascaris univalens TaxID=6257 RepID=A0A915AKT8_PARUN
MVIRGKNATLVVLGDIGRSPRMCYHAKSLADKNYHVHIVGYADTIPHPTISQHPNIRIIALRPPPASLNNIRPTIGLILKFFWTLSTLLFALFFRIEWPLLIMMQNPPGVPCMFACWLAARIRRAQFVIDWHNYTYSILREKYALEGLRTNRVAASTVVTTPDEPTAAVASLNVGSGDVRSRRMTKGERAVQMANAIANKKKRYVEKKKKISMLQRFVEQTYYWEGYFGRHADLNICVTHAMREDMRDAWAVHSATLYDRPPSWNFKKLNDEERHTLFLKLSQLGGDFRAFAWEDSKGTLADEDITEVTRISFRDGDGVARLRDDRPLLLLSSTSWTEDEDFGLLLDALREFDSIARLSTKANPQTRLPHLLCVITGRGPLRSHYIGRIEHLQMQQVEVITPWLEPDDYPRLLGAADVGVSLHTSTSGLDLPMKVVDMFGCGLPVIAKRFACISELVNEGHNGRLFDNCHELSQIIKSLSCGFPTYSTQLHTLATNLESDPLISWDKNWDACMWPLICSYGAAPRDEVARRQRYAVIDVSDRNSPRPSDGLDGEDSDNEERSEEDAASGPEIDANSFSPGEEEILKADANKIDVNVHPKKLTVSDVDNAPQHEITEESGRKQFGESLRIVKSSEKEAKEDANEESIGELNLIEEMESADLEVMENGQQHARNDKDVVNGGKPNE